MCGILGHFSFDGAIGDVNALVEQVNALQHRGPDDGTWWQDGPFFFGHRRLSIIDVSHGGQPMASADGRLVVTYNGEIYNYIELRDELRSHGCAFVTESDTEVLLHGYRIWGETLLARLKGMFAFAIADRRVGTLFIARDRFGEKPILYVERKEGVTFASEMRPLTALGHVSRDIDEAGLAAYLCLNYVPGDRTMLASVRRVSPGTWRLYDSTGLVNSGRYWDPTARRAAIVGLTEEDALAELEMLLDRSVRMSLRSDVPVGVFLSGGIDSSLISHSAVRSGKLSRAYCLAMPDRSYSEWDAASSTARKLGVPITRVMLEATALDDFLSLVEHADDPLADSSALAVYTLSRAAATTNKVVIGGDGGDELFGGYLTYPATLWHAVAISPLPMWLRRGLAWTSTRLPTSESKVSRSYKLWRFLRAAPLSSAEAHFTWNGTWLPAQAAEFLTQVPGQSLANDCLRSMASRLGVGANPTLEQLQRADVADYLPNDILAKGDRMSMAHGLEIRSPFLEPDLADFALALPAKFKAGLRGSSKRILRRLALKRYGSELASSQKQGFSIPVHSWLRGPARARVHELLSPSAVSAIPQLEPRTVTQAVEAHMSGRRSYGFELWGLMVLVAWYQSRVASPAATPLGAAPRRVEIPCAAETQ